MQAIFLDIETTGLDPNKHRAIDIAFQVVDITKGGYQRSYQSLIKQPQEAWKMSDPASLEVNGFTWDEVAAGKEPSQVQDEIISLLSGLGVQRGHAVFICQNPAFDRSFFTQLIDVYTQEKLNWPYHWLDLASMYWTLLNKEHLKQGIPFPEALSLSKNDIAKNFNIPQEERPHRAMKGVEHLISCYEKVLGVRFQ